MYMYLVYCSTPPRPYTLFSCSSASSGGISMHSIGVSSIGSASTTLHCTFRGITDAAKPTCSPDALRTQTHWFVNEETEIFEYSKHLPQCCILFKTSMNHFCEFRCFWNCYTRASLNLHMNTRRNWKRYCMWHWLLSTCSLSSIIFPVICIAQISRCLLIAMTSFPSITLSSRSFGSTMTYFLQAINAWSFTCTIMYWINGSLTLNKRKRTWHKSACGEHLMESDLDLPENATKVHSFHTCTWTLFATLSRKLNRMHAYLVNGLQLWYLLLIQSRLVVWKMKYMYTQCTWKPFSKQYPCIVC